MPNYREVEALSLQQRQQQQQQILSVINVEFMNIPCNTTWVENGQKRKKRSQKSLILYFSTQWRLWGSHRYIYITFKSTVPAVQLLANICYHIMFIASIYVCLSIYICLSVFYSVKLHGPAHWTRTWRYVCSLFYYYFINFGNTPRMMWLLCSEGHVCTLLTK